MVKVTIKYSKADLRQGIPIQSEYTPSKHDCNQNCRIELQIHWLMPDQPIDNQ